jgi:hypothetical protein
MPNRDARTAAAAKLAAFVNKRLAERCQIIRLHDSDALAVVDAIAAATMEEIQRMLCDEPHDGSRARSNTR